MTIQNDALEGKPDAADTHPRPQQSKPVLITPVEFFQGVTVKHPDAVQCRVTRGSNGALNDHLWNKEGADFALWIAEKIKDIKPAYYSVFGFPPDAVSRHEGRTKANAVAARSFCIDVEGSAKKFAKPDGPAKGYANSDGALSAIKHFVKASGIKPNYLVDTGSGGWHIYYDLDKDHPPEIWLSRAKCLVRLAELHGLKIDAPCTTNAAQIMRAPGSIHQDTGKVVTAYRLRETPYTLDEFDRRLGYVPDDEIPPKSPESSGSSAEASNDIIGNREYSKYSYQHAATQCAAMREAAANNGRDAAYPVWILALRAAALSTEGAELAHDVSSGHADYDPVETEKKLNSLNGGPAGCAAWAAAYGVCGPCDNCSHKGVIKNPAIQFGAIVSTTPPGSVEVLDSAQVPPWVAELNQRYALVRHGAKIAIVDFKTPSMTGRGVANGFGFLNIEAFHAVLKGRFVPGDAPGDKQRALSGAWLAHTHRRQYEGLVYAPPPEPLPSNILNLWQGFAVPPIAGPVLLWLRVLVSLVPDKRERLYVLRWLAWKIQNPGAVPDTILIFKGAKGTGKSSLFDPIVLLFGRHAMLADDPELIAGRFTWHLMHLSFAVLDEAVFVGDPRQADRIKSRVTAKTMHYEQKGMDPVQGVNRCAYVMLTNHEHVWQATNDERRAVVVEVGQRLLGRPSFWSRYHPWAQGDGPAALLHYLQGVDLTGFNPRVIPKGEALRKQVEQTALRSAAAAWWCQCLSEGAVHWSGGRPIHLDDVAPTPIPREVLRQSYEQSSAGRRRNGNDWNAVAKKLNEWAGQAGIQKLRAPATTNGGARGWIDVLPQLPDLKVAFTAATQIRVAP